MAIKENDLLAENERIVLRLPKGLIKYLKRLSGEMPLSKFMSQKVLATFSGDILGIEPPKQKKGGKSVFVRIDAPKKDIVLISKAARQIGLTRQTILTVSARRMLSEIKHGYLRKTVDFSTMFSGEDRKSFERKDKYLSLRLDSLEKANFDNLSDTLKVGISRFLLFSARYWIEWYIQCDSVNEFSPHSIGFTLPEADKDKIDRLSEKHNIPGKQLVVLALLEFIKGSV